MVSLQLAWAKKMLQRMGFVRWKGMKAAREIPTDFDNIRNEFHARIKQKVVEQYSIRPSTLFNWDQAVINIVPCCDWTLAVKGLKRVAMFDLEDKRQITVMFCVSLDGTCYHRDFLYQGKLQ